MKYVICKSAGLSTSAAAEAEQARNSHTLTAPFLSIRSRVEHGTSYHDPGQQKANWVLYSGQEQISCKAGSRWEGELEQSLGRNTQARLGAGEQEVSQVGDN